MEGRVGRTGPGAAPVVALWPSQQQAPVRATSEARIRKVVSLVTIYAKQKNPGEVPREHRRKTKKSRGATPGNWFQSKPRSFPHTKSTRMVITARIKISIMVPFG